MTEADVQSPRLRRTLKFIEAFEREHGAAAPDGASL